jgi:hypothetical protein
MLLCEAKLKVEVEILIALTIDATQGWNYGMGLFL